MIVGCMVLSSLEKIKVKKCPAASNRRAWIGECVLSAAFGADAKKVGLN